MGPFFAQGIVLRGAGAADMLSEDETTRRAVGRAYGLPGPVSPEELRRRAEAWRPFRGWATVFLHVWWRREGGGPPP